MCVDEIFWDKIVFTMGSLSENSFDCQGEQLVKKQVSEKYRFAWFKLYATRSIRYNRGRT